jgi:hypothetical protein
MVTALFSDRESAERGYRSAGELGYEKADVTLLMSDETCRRHFPDGRQSDTELGNKANETLEKTSTASDLGGPVGGTVGTLAPAAAAVGTVLLIPGIIFAGPVAIALAAAGAVGLVGGVMGALTNWGMPTDRVKQYEESIRAGGIVMGVKARTAEDARALEERWKASGGRLVHS